MTKFEKLTSRFLTRPKDFTYNELKRLLSGFGYIELQGSGSRVVFINEKLKHSIKLHRPHPGNILRTYQIDLVLNELKSNNLV
jgi:hypothetical protein